MFSELHQFWSWATNIGIAGAYTVWLCLAIGIKMFNFLEDRMSIVVYYHTGKSGPGTVIVPSAEYFGADELSVALSRCQELRNSGKTYVVMSCENSDQVGELGVSSVENGKTPDGEDYKWSKAGRAGKPRKSDAGKSTIATKNGD